MSITIGQFTRNAMGTVSFAAQFDGMRKAQDFIVYPVAKDHPTDRVLVQSDTRIGHIQTATGDITLAGPHAGGAYQHHLHLARPAGKLDPLQLLLLKSNIATTANRKAGSRGVHTDNSGASGVF